MQSWFYSAGTVIGVPDRVERFSTQPAPAVRRSDRRNHLPCRVHPTTRTSHLRFNETAASLNFAKLPDPTRPDPTRPARCAQEVVARRHRSGSFSGPGVLAGRDDGERGARSDGLVTLFRVVSAIAAGAGNALVGRSYLQRLVAPAYYVVVQHPPIELLDAEADVDRLALAISCPEQAR